jgi:two-component system cell cycle sensor histidine kinase/response regulator CckA
MDEARIQFLQELIDIFPFYVLVLDNRHRIVLMNRYLVDLKNISPKILIGKYCYRVYHNLDHPFPGCPLELAVQKQTIAAEDFFDSTIQRWIRAKIYPLPPSYSLNGSELYLHFSEDITHLKMLEEESIKAQSVDMVRFMSRGLTHDIMNLLQNLLSHATIAQITADLSEKQIHLTQIVSSIAQIKKMTQDLANFSSDIVLDQSPNDINDIIHTFLQTQIVPPQILIQTDLAKNLPILNLDRFKLLEVLQNLMNNALQAIENTGTIWIRTGLREIDNSSTLGLEKGHYVFVAVKDSGCGIAPENLPRIFFPLFTTKNQGNGLGLAMSQSIIKTHGGLITVDSTPHEGSEFTIYFPIKASNYPKSV